MSYNGIPDNQIQTTDAETDYFTFYHYTPSFAASLIATIFFALLTITHVRYLVGYRTYYFIPLAIGGVLETVGYAGRLWSHYNPTALGAYVIQAILILVAPALYAATIYMLLGRLIKALHAASLSPIPPRISTKLFVLGDAVAFSLQAAGGGLLGSGALELFNVGRSIIVAGLFAQLVFFGFFVIVAAVFNTRAWRSPDRRIHTSEIAWQEHLIVLYATSILILVRCIVRVVEYLQGNAGYVISHEVFQYVFDTAPMLATMIVFLKWYPADIEYARRLDGGSGAEVEQVR